MGESAVVMRSYTHPASSHESLEGDPIQALTASISFGRFMSESLDWGKWSSFSHNRHIEEAEKFSKPGSVAEKKAYFEAHYKKIAAVKKATALVEEANVVNSNPVDASYIPNEAHAQSSTDSKPTEASTIAAFNELENVESTIEEHCKLENNGHVENPDEPDNVANEDEIVVSHEETSSVKDTSVLVAKKQVITSSNSLASTSKSKSPLPAKTTTSAQLGKDTIITLSNMKIENSLASASKSKSPLPAKTTTSAQLGKDTIITLCNMKIERGLVDRKRKFTQSLHLSINQDSFASITNRKQEISSSRSSVSSIKSKLPFSAKLTIPVQPIKEANVTSRSNNKSLHMPIKEDTIRLIRNTKLEKSSSKAKLPFPAILTSSSQLKKEITATSSSKKAGKFVAKKINIPMSLHMSINLSCHDSVPPKLETIRQGDGNCTSTLSLDHAKSSTRCESKTRTTTLSSPFSFRSEERATKRKEFFQKIKEKKNATNAEKVQMQIIKEKAENGVRNLRQSFVSSTKTAADSTNHITSSPSKPRKVLPTRKQSPKPGQKPITTNITQDTNYQPHRRPPVKNGGYGSSNSTGKLNQSFSHSISSLYKKKTHENVSPNILI